MRIVLTMVLGQEGEQHMDVGLSLFELVIALLVAFGAGAVAIYFRQPVVLGYLLAGLAIGPFALGLVQHVDQVQILADVGVAFLMFALGVEISLKELQRVRNVAIFGGIIQLGVTIALGVGLGLALGWPLLQAVFFGALISLSSTMVVMKLLMDRGETETLHGRISLGFLIVQDFSVVPMMVVLPAIAGQTENLPLSLGLAGLKALVLIFATLYLGTKIVPKLLFWVASTRSRELFSLSIVAICLGTAFATYLLGLSIAFGAFLAGVVVSDSMFRHEILAETRSLRDVFSVLFFVSVGMLINPAFMVENTLVVLLVALVILIGKFFIVFCITVGFGYSGKVATLGALALVQIGEFSFVMAKLGTDQGIISDYVYSLTLTSALLTILATPFIIQLGPTITAQCSRVPFLKHIFARESREMKSPAETLSQHVVICGHGDVGCNLTRVLETRQFKYFVIDNDPGEIARLRAKGVPCVYGDAANSHVLAQANLPKAKVLAITGPDPGSTDLIIKQAKRINPRLDIVARAHSNDHLEFLRGSGATAIVEPKFEAGLEVIRHTLHRFGVSTPEVLMLLSKMRVDRYVGLEDNRSRTNTRPDEKNWAE